MAESDLNPRVIFINDLSFSAENYLSLVGHLQCFLMINWDVKVLCFQRMPENENINFTVTPEAGQWDGVDLVSHGTFDERINDLCQRILAYKADLIIIARVHSVFWPPKVYKSLFGLKIPMVVYMEDCFIATGRCIYTGGCIKYSDGCDETCPTSQEYPKLNPQKISLAWKAKRKLFSKKEGFVIAANSRWTAQFINETNRDLDSVKILYPGIDHHLYHPIDKNLARTILSIPQDKPVILFGDYTFHPTRNGIHFIKEIYAALRFEATFLVLSNKEFPGQEIYTSKHIDDYRKLPLIYGAADLFVNTALESSFNTSVMIAQACGKPVVAFDVSSIREIVQEGKTARLVRPFEVDEMIQKIRSLITKPDLMKNMGIEARNWSSQTFDLEKLKTDWIQFLKDSQVLNRELAC